VRGLPDLLERAGFQVFRLRAGGDNDTPTLVTVGRRRSDTTAAGTEGDGNEAETRVSVLK